MLFVSSAHCLGVLLLLLFVVYCGVRRLCGISVMLMTCVSSGCLWGGFVLGTGGYRSPQYSNLRPGIVQPGVKLETREGRDAAVLHSEAWAY